MMIFVKMMKPPKSKGQVTDIDDLRASDDIIDDEDIGDGGGIGMETKAELREISTTPRISLREKMPPERLKG